MCAIAGLLYTDSTRVCPEDALRAMRDVMTHRGPDDAGMYRDANLGLAHRRLSIIDLGTGQQPMSTPDGQLCVVFNGEIYNYRELRADLERRGHVFRTHSDTEVLLYLYREFGDCCAERLNGIFAFAVWDKTQRRLFLARDHMGVKPLYYAALPQVFAFASEIKALFKSGEITPQLETDVVPEHFVFGHVAGERTLFRGVRALLPGHVMTVVGNAIETRPYWSPLPERQREESRASDALEELQALLESAVGMQMVSDVPLGTFCSGGVDSSMVSAICAQRSGMPINTYSIGFHERDHDETRYAQMVARRYQTRHHELRVDQREFAELLPRMIWHNDEPLHFANSVQIYALSRLAKHEVTVVLTGEGADELFAGYPRYLIPPLVARLQQLPGPVRRFFRSLGRYAPDARLRKLIAVMDLPLAESELFNAARGLPLQARRFWNLPQQLRERRALYERYGAASSLQRVSWIDQHTYLVSILHRQDKMSMAASVESRVPVLDYRIVEFANALPDRLKQQGRKTKVIWKRLAERYLPRQVVHRRKSGFGVPLASWLNVAPGLGDMVRELVSARALPELDGVLPIDTLANEHRVAQADHSDVVWSALNFVLWKRAFGLT